MADLCIWNLDLQLRRMFESVASEPVPAHLLALIEQLEAQAASGGLDGGADAAPPGAAEPTAPVGEPAVAALTTRMPTA